MNQPTAATRAEHENGNEHPASAVARIFQAWDEALGAKDLDASMALYRPDATLESPLVRHLLGTAEGVVRGKDDLRRFVEIVFANSRRSEAVALRRPAGGCRGRR
ncbi:MAG: hypothetical protein QOD04_2686 [Pseudonocardiales bacterium]|jgi:ketosteroid isomerase-like protein|nr:hypothetical protein [Pseudonocardiales bacterium]